MNTHLSKNVTIGAYQDLEHAADRIALSNFMLERFTERYVTPMRVDPTQKNGFTIMAISCLMIEALESFYQGWPNSKNKSQLAFCQIFDRNQSFSFLRGYSSEFYIHVRCGILHQAETTGGWHIRRKGSVFEESEKKINAKLFHDKVEEVLKLYCNDLSQSEWSSKIWVNFRKKMRAVCKNCQ
tara:strand:+ start:832 stop:1380 length:549 start_codon:yes stop_codon:yes gene_type:complete